MSATQPTDVSSLLLTLEEISTLVSHSHRPGETLANIVRLIQGRFHTDVCSVYLLEPESGHMVLGATVGLRQEGVGRVRMRPDEGLTGLVAERLGPVVVDDAFTHPRFKYFPEAGEDPYHSFLGVPLIEGGALQGVLVVQTGEPRNFTADEVRMMVTVAAQLAPLVGEARLLEWVVAATREGTGKPVPAPAPLPEAGMWQGVSLSSGTGIGEAYLVGGETEWQPTESDCPVDPAREEHRLQSAMWAATDELERQGRHIAELLGEDHGGILQAQLMILQDGAIQQELHDRLSAGDAAEQAVVRTLAKYTAAFQGLAASFFRDRVYDLKDVFRRLLWHLRPRPATDSPVGDRLVLVAREASVLDLFAVDLERLAAVVVEQGGPQCHAAILARSLGIPMVGQVPDIVARLTSGSPLEVDGAQGRVSLAPASDLTRPLSPVMTPHSNGVAAPIEAACGAPRLEANINLFSEAGQAVARGAAGVGLFRSEFLLAARRNFPTEEEQVCIYRKLLTRLGGRPVTIRTFDVRAAQPATAGADGAALDWRLVLQSTAMQQVFKEQVRAILRAGALGPARLLVPLVTRTEQLDLVADMVEQARAELADEGLEPGRRVPLGVMIEVAAAVPLVEAWAPRVDFFALGTNDLTASALGLDRDRPIGSSPDDVLHPGLFRLVRDAVSAARQAGKPITVCGELAAAPTGSIALTALGVDALSVAVDRLTEVRKRLQRVPPAELAEELGRAKSGREMGDVIRAWMKAD